jgi:hypothetical protein
VRHAYDDEVTVTADVLTYLCRSCGRPVEAHEAHVVRSRETEMRACPSCGSALVAERSRIVQPLHEQLLAVLRWPLTPATGATIFGVAGVTTFFSFLGEPGIAFAHAVRCLYLFAVLRAAARGKSDPEVDPGRFGGDAYEWLTGPSFRMFATLFVAFAPAVAVHLVLRSPVVTTAIALAGAIYLPAALIVTAHDDRVGAALSPLVVYRLVRAIPRAYATTCAFLAALTAFGILGVVAAGAVGGAAGAVAAGIVGFVPCVLGARMLGVLVDAHDEELVP